jgi:hypothetical protein
MARRSLTPEYMPIKNLDAYRKYLDNIDFLGSFNLHEVKKNIIRITRDFETKLYNYEAGINPFSIN